MKMSYCPAILVILSLWFLPASLYAEKKPPTLIYKSFQGKFLDDGQQGTVRITITSIFDSRVAIFTIKSPNCTLASFPMAKLSTVSVNWATFSWKKSYGSVQGLLATPNTYVHSGISWSKITTMGCKLKPQKNVKLFPGDS